MTCGKQEDPTISFFPFAIGVICGCAAVNFVNALICLPVLVCSFLLSRRHGIWCTAGLLAGLAALTVDTYMTDRASGELPDRPSRISLVCRSCDTRPVFIQKIPFPESFTAEIISSEKRKHSFSTRISVRPGKGYFPRYGETFSGSGRFVPADRKSPYGKYLLSRKIAGVWYPDDVKSLLPPSGIFHHLCRLRDVLLERTIEDIRSPVASVMAGTMFFGVSGGFDRSIRQVFLDSGTLHLFSVSGMHLAAVCMLFLIPSLLLPFRIRYLVLSFFISVYAFSTGANPPVLRALIVVLIWCAAKAFCFRKSSLELLSLAAAILFLREPSLIFNIGAQYSFFITLILIFTAGRLKEFKSKTGIFCSHAPHSKELVKRQREYRFFRRILCAFAGCCIAFGASAGIAVTASSPVLPGAVLMNFLLCFFLPFLFLLAGLKLLFGPWFPGVVLEHVLLVLEKFCFEGSSFFLPLNLILVWKYEALLFCILLCCSVGFPFRKVRYTAAIAAAGLFLLWMVRPDFQKPEIFIVSQDSGLPPVIAIAEPREDLGFLINFSNYRMTQRAVDFLTGRGIRRAEAFLFSNEKKAAQSIRYAAASLSPRRLCLPGSPSPQILRQIRENGLGNVSNGAGEQEFVKIFKEKSSWRLEYFNPGSKLSFRIKWCDTPQGRQIFINDDPVRCISWSNSQEVICYGF